MNIKLLLKRNNGFSTALFIIGFGIFIASLLIINYLFAGYSTEIEAFFDDATVDCFLANRAALVQLKSEYSKCGYEGDFEAEKCKKYLRLHLSQAFNLQSHDDDVMLANESNRFIRALEIKEYGISSKNKVSCLIYITARPYFFSNFFHDPVYKIKTEVYIAKIKY